MKTDDAVIVVGGGGSSLQGEHGQFGVTSLVLSLGAFVGRVTQTVIRTALTTIPPSNLAPMEKNHLVLLLSGPSEDWNLTQFSHASFLNNAPVCYDQKGRLGNPDVLFSSQIPEPSFKPICQLPTSVRKKHCTKSGMQESSVRGALGFLPTKSWRLKSSM